MHLEDLLAARAIGRQHRNPPVEAPGAQQRRVEDLGAVRRRHHDHAGGRVEAVHLGQDLVERLLALVVAAADARAGAAGAPDRVELVDEDDRRRVLLGLGEEVRTRDAPTPTMTSTNSLAEIEKNGTPASPATARASSVLPVPGWPLSSTPRGIFAPRRLYLLGVLEEVDDLDELVLGLVDAGHVGERDALLGVLAAARARAPERREHRRPAGAAHQQDQQADEQQRRAEARAAS